MARVERLGRDAAVGWNVLAAMIAVATAAVGSTPARADVDLETRFALLDEDGDGVVTRAEFQRTKTQIFFFTLDAAGADQHLRPGDTPLTAEVFARADSDGDGLLSGSEFVLAPFVQFDAFDADNDGKITVAEFLAAARRFVIDN